MVRFRARLVCRFGFAAGRHPEPLGEAVEPVFFAAFYQTLRRFRLRPLSPADATQQIAGFCFDDRMEIRRETRRGKKRKKPKSGQQMLKTFSTTSVGRGSWRGSTFGE